MEVATMRGFARANSREFNEQRQRELTAQYGSFREAGSRPNQMSDLLRDMEKWGMKPHRGASQDGPTH